MATDPNQQKSSVQRKETPRPVKYNFLLPMGDLTEKEINMKSTLDKRKRRIAHVPKFLHAVKENPVKPKSAIKPEPKIVPKKKQHSNTKPCKVATLDGNRAKVRQTNSRNPAGKRKARDDGNEAKNKKRNVNVAKSKSREEKSRKWY